MKSVFQISVTASYKYVRIIKNVTERFLLSEGICEEEVYMIKLAIAEAAANIIKHSYCMECETPIEYKIEKENGKYHRGYPHQIRGHESEIFPGHCSESCKKFH